MTPIRFNPISGNFEFGAGTKTVKLNGRGGAGSYVGISRILAGSNIAVSQNGNEVTISSTAISSPGGSDTQIQFNDGGSFGGDSGLTFDKNNDILTLGLENSDGTLTARTATSGDTAGGSLVMTAGNGLGTGSGGAIGIVSGTGGETGNGGTANLSGGDGGSTSGTGGTVTISGGSAQGGNSNGGSVRLQSGQAAGAGTSGAVIVVSPYLGVGSGSLARLDTSKITANQTYSFPDETGILATQNFSIAMAIALG